MNPFTRREIQARIDALNALINRARHDKRMAELDNDEQMATYLQSEIDGYMAQLKPLIATLKDAKEN